MCWLSSEWEAFDDLQCSLKIFWRNPISSRSHWFHFSLFEIYSIMLCFFYLFLCLKMYSIFPLILINVYVFGHSVMMFCSICLIKCCSNSFCTFLRKLQRPFRLVLSCFSHSTMFKRLLLYCLFLLAFILYWHHDMNISIWFAFNFTQDSQAMVSAIMVISCQLYCIPLLYQMHTAVFICFHVPLLIAMMHLSAHWSRDKIFVWFHKSACGT